MALDIPLPTADPANDPAQYIPLLMSSIEGFLQTKDIWQAADYEAAFLYMEKLKTYVVNCFGKCNDVTIYPKSISIDPLLARKVVGSSILVSLLASQINNMLVEITPIAVDNAMDWEVNVAAGKYTLEVWGARGTNFGQVGTRVDGASIAGAQTWYAATAAQNIKYTYTVIFPTDGNHFLQLVSPSKDAASSNYRFNLSGATLRWFALP